MLILAGPKRPTTAIEFLYLQQRLEPKRCRLGGRMDERDEKIERVSMILSYHAF
jgi:hypothetical protein